MKSKLAVFLFACFAASSSFAQITIDDFNAGTTTGSVVAGTNWVGQVSQGPTSLVVTGGENNGWGATGVSLNATGMNFIAVTASVDSGNLAGSFTIRFADDNLEPEVFSTPTTQFSSTMSTVYIPVSWTSSIDISNITSWSIGGGNVGATAFHMTFDNLSFAMTAAPVPEPSTYAMLLGAAGLGFAIWRRKVRA